MAARREFGWSDRTARNFMSVAELAGKSETISDLNADMRGLYLLASSSTPPDVIDAVAERDEQGERVPVAEIEKMIAEAKAVAAKEKEAEVALAIAATAKEKQAERKVSHSGKHCRVRSSIFSPRRPRRLRSSTPLGDEQIERANIKG